MNTHNLCCIGHITLDKIVTPKRTLHMPGGTSFYFAHGMSKLDTSDFLLVTALAVSEMDAVEEIRRKGIDVKVLPSTHSVYFENTYGENQNNRTQRVLAKADPFTVEGLQDVDARIYHLGSLLADDFSLDVIKYLSTKGMLSVDVAIPIWPAICTCETKELHTKKQDVLPPPCVQSSWKPRDLSGEQRRMFGILSKGISETIYDFRFMIYELCITDKS